MGALIPIGLGLLGGLFGGRSRNREAQNQHAQAAWQAQTQTQALNRRRAVMARLFQQYGLNPAEFGFGDVLNPTQQRTEQQDLWTIAAPPMPQTTPGWESALGGAAAGFGAYMESQPQDPFSRMTPNIGGGPTFGGGGGQVIGGRPGGRGYELSGMYR